MDKTRFKDQLYLLVRIRLTLSAFDERKSKLYSTIFNQNHPTLFNQQNLVISFVQEQRNSITGLTFHG